MRILSQDGLIFNDIPYEKFVFGIVRDMGTDKFCVVANKDSTVSESGYPLNGIMAEYSTEAKARKAMEMLRRFSETRGFSNIPNIIIDNKEFFEMLKKSFLISYEEKNKKSIIPDVTITLERYSNYFQFPQDSEIEV